MKSIEFSEERLHDVAAIAEELFNDEHDPRSTSYVRELKRPHINWFKICVCVFLPIALAISFAVILKIFGASVTVSVLIASALLLLYILLTLKSSIICMIKVYQRYAPDSIRNKCRFEPSCSEYMILSLKKYGLLKGLRKGINRLKRCNIHDGGYDLP